MSSEALFPRIMVKLGEVVVLDVRSRGLTRSMDRGVWIQYKTGHSMFYVIGCYTEYYARDSDCFAMDPASDTLAG